MANYGFGLSQDAIKVLGDAQQYRQRLGMENAQMLNSLSAAQLQNRMNAQQANASYGFEDPNLVNQVNVPQALQNYMGGQGNNAQQAAPGLEQGLPVGTASAVQAPRGAVPTQGQAMAPQQGQAGMPPQGQAGLPMRANPYDVAQARQIYENENALKAAQINREVMANTILGKTGLATNAAAELERTKLAAQAAEAEKERRNKLIIAGMSKTKVVPTTPQEKNILKELESINKVLYPVGRDALVGASKKDIAEARSRKLVLEQQLTDMKRKPQSVGSSLIPSTNGVANAPAPQMNPMVMQHLQAVKAKFPHLTDEQILNSPTFQNFVSQQGQ